MGAYYSSGSRPNQNAHSWAYARLASTLMKSKAYRVDKHILDEAGVKIKPPPKKRSKKYVDLEKILYKINIDYLMIILLIILFKN